MRRAEIGEAYLTGVVIGALATCVVLAMTPGCAATDHVEIAPDEDLCEREAALRGAECATVYAFAEPADNELGHVEKCTPERYLVDAQRRHGIAWPSDSDRFTDITKGLVDPKCFWCISPGANAYDGCWLVTP